MVVQPDEDAQHNVVETYWNISPLVAPKAYCCCPFVASVPAGPQVGSTWHIEQSIAPVPHGVLWPNCVPDESRPKILLPSGSLHVVCVCVGTSTKQRLQSVRTELVVLPQVVVAVYASPGTPPYCLPCGTTSLHTVWVLVCVAVQHSAIVHVTGLTITPLSLKRSVTC